MAIRELKQTHYLDVADPNIRHDTRDHRQDMTHYHVPLMRLHQAALHGWGIAVGLEVTQTGPAELTIAEGLAVDAEGRILPAAAAGHAPGQPGKAFVHNTSPGSLVDVPVIVPVEELPDGTYHVTMALAQTLGPEGQPVEGRFLANEGRIVSTPLVKLQPTVNFPPDGQAIILATVTLEEGAITQLHGADRQLVHLAAGGMAIRRSAKVAADEAAPAVGETVSGRFGPLATGGVQVAVPAASDKVVVQREGQHNFQELTVRADHLRVLDGAGRAVLHVEANTATLEVAGEIKATAFHGNGSALTEVTDNTKVSKTGDTMTGSLTISAAGRGLHCRGDGRVGGDLSVGKRIGIGTSNPPFPLSLGRSLGRTKLAIYETGPSNSYGLGVTAGTFRLHLNGNRARFAFFNGGKEDAEEIVTIRGNGDLTVAGRNARKPGGGPWASNSDVRLKKNIQQLKGALDALLRLRGIRFEWIEPEKHGNLAGQQIGMVAQEVQAIFPEWVGTNPEGYKELSIRGFEALTVEALRELQADYAACQARCQALEARVEALEKQALAQNPMNPLHMNGET